MIKNTSDVADTQGRHITHVIHYDLSYILQGAEHGTDGAIVLLHDIPAGALVSGAPAVDHKLWLKYSAILPRLPEIARAVRATKPKD